MRTKVLALFATLVTAAGAQTSTPVTTNNGTPPTSPATSLPSAPSAPIVAPAPGVALPGSQVAVPGTPPIQQLPSGFTAPVVPPNAPSLTVGQAEQLALQRNPRVTVARLLALAQGQVTREQRAAEMPTFAGNVTAVGADNGTRLTAGALNNPVLYQRAAAGVTLNQLITDFGRTRNLVTQASLNAQAAQNTVEATRDDVVFAVDEAFYRALGAQALIQVAEQTVNARQATAKPPHLIIAAAQSGISFPALIAARENRHAAITGRTAATNHRRRRPVPWSARTPAPMISVMSGAVGSKCGRKRPTAEIAAQNRPSIARTFIARCPLKTR